MIQVTAVEIQVTAVEIRVPLMGVQLFVMKCPDRVCCSGELPLRRPGGG